MNITMNLENELKTLVAQHRIFLQKIGAANVAGCKNIVFDELRIYLNFQSRYDGCFGNIEKYVSEFIRQSVTLSSNALTLTLAQITENTVSFYGDINGLYVICYLAPLGGVLMDGIYVMYTDVSHAQRGVCRVGQATYSF